VGCISLPTFQRCLPPWSSVRSPSVHFSTELCRLFISFPLSRSKTQMLLADGATSLCLPLLAHPISLHLSEQFLNSLSFIFIWLLDTLNRIPIVYYADTLHEPPLEKVGSLFHLPAPRAPPLQLHAAPGTVSGSASFLLHVYCPCAWSDPVEEAINILVI
jgi:hypothetical protein